MGTESYASTINGTGLLNSRWHYQALQDKLLLRCTWYS